jgi:hypothetical protein
MNSANDLADRRSAPWQELLLLPRRKAQRSNRHPGRKGIGSGRDPLPQVRDRLSSVAGPLCIGDNGKGQGDHEGDYGNYDHEFDKSEGVRSHR